MAARELFKVLTSSQMLEVERRSAEAGVDERQLQRNAARAIASLLLEHLGRDGTSTVVVAAGPGNNGRDAVLAGQHLALAGARVLVYLSPRHAMLPAELDALAREGVETLLHQGDSSLARLEEWLKVARVALDGLLGIGVRGAMREPLASIAETINRASAARGDSLLVVAVDVPSGIDADTGAVPGTAVQADQTLALGSIKTGLLRFPAAEMAGTIVPLPIGLPPGITDPYPLSAITAEQAREWLPPRPLAAHKGTFGRVLVLGGSRDYVGAPVLCASAAARAGAGLVALAVPEHARAAAATLLPEAIHFPVPSGAPEKGSEQLQQAVLHACDTYHSLVVGPGLGRSPGASSLVLGILRGLSERSTRPTVVLDGDGLNALAAAGQWWQWVPRGNVLTPHYGEMSRLTGLDTSQVAQNTWDLALEKASQWGQVVVLKGPFTVVASPEGKAWVNLHANPALATAGTGDVLSGLIGGLIAQGCEPFFAAALGVYVHSRCAASVQSHRRWRTLLASDLLQEIPAVINGKS